MDRTAREILRMNSDYCKPTALEETMLSLLFSSTHVQQPAIDSPEKHVPIIVCLFDLWDIVQHPSELKCSKVCSCVAKENSVEQGVRTAGLERSWHGATRLLLETKSRIA